MSDAEKIKDALIACRGNESAALFVLVVEEFAALRADVARLDESIRSFAGRLAEIESALQEDQGHDGAEQRRRDRGDGQPARAELQQLPLQPGDRQ